MPYVTSVERLAKQEGMELGIELGTELATELGTELGIARAIAPGIARAIERGIERGIARAIERGALQCSRDLLLQTIQIRFGQIPDPLRASINACTSTEQLSDFHRRALLANSLGELPAHL